MDININFYKFWLNFDVHRYDGFGFWPKFSSGYFGFRCAFITFLIGKYLKTEKLCHEVDELRFNLVERRRERAYRIVNKLTNEWPNLDMEGWDNDKAVSIILENWV